MLGLSGGKIYHGPSPYAMEPVVVADLRLGPLATEKSGQIMAEMAALSDAWFIPRPVPSSVAAGDGLVHFLLHWSLSALNWMKGALGTAGFRRIDDETVRLWIEFHKPPTSYTALLTAVQAANAAAEGRSDAAQLSDMLDRFWIECRAKHPDSSDELIIRAARAAGVPYFRGWGLGNVWQFGWGARSQAIRSASSNLDGYLAGQVFADKMLSKELIESLGFPTPTYAALKSEADIPAAAEKVGFPCVVKPIDQGGGKGIKADIASIEDIAPAYRYARATSNQPIMLEAFVQGSDHRLLVIDGRFVGAFRREQPAVVGDGERSLAELVKAANRRRAPTGVFNAHNLTRIVLDEIAIEYIARQGLGPDSVVPAGQEITVRSNANLTSGGSCHPVTVEIHPDVIAMAEGIAKVAQSRMIGLDYLTTDIGRSWHEVPGALIELNLTPGLGIPTLAGRSKLEIGRLALGSEPGRIPLDLVVVTDELLPEAEARIARLPDDASGWATHDKAAIGRMPLRVSVSQPWSGVLMLLSHRTVKRAVVVATARQLQAHGLPIDRADRIWLFTDHVPNNWREVLKRACPSPLLEGDWAALEASWQEAPPTSWKAGWD